MTNHEPNTNDEQPLPDDQVQRLWTRPTLLAGAVVLAIIYGSLIPFDFEWSGTVKAAGGVFPALLGALGSPSWVLGGPGYSSLGIPYALSDIVMNLLLYLPLGVTVRMALRARRPGWWFEVVGTAVIGFSLSWGVESLQGMSATRVASLNDIALNTAAALVAALVAPYLWGLYKRLSFVIYCKLGLLAGRLAKWGERPSVAMLIAGVNALIIGGWYVLEVRRSVGGDELALPFERAFNLPYDLGVLVLGRSLLVYAGLGCLLLLLTITGKRRVAMGWVVLGVALLALAAELTRALTRNAAPDITGPLLALTAGALMTITIYTFSLAVKRSNRRSKQQRYDGPERRRRPHEYV